MTAGSSTLAHTPLFAALDPAAVQALDTRCVWRKLRAGEWVIDHQSDGMDVFFVLAGRARVVIGGSGREIILRDIHDGEYFGELSAIDGQPRSAGIVALTDATVAQMPSKVFRETIHQHPSVCDKVMVTLVGAIRALNIRVDEQVNLDVRERLCSELLRLSRKTGEGRLVVSPPPNSCRTCRKDRNASRGGDENPQRTSSAKRRFLAHAAPLSFSMSNACARSSPRRGRSARRTHSASSPCGYRIGCAAHSD